MVVEMALLDVRPGRAAEFESAFAEARAILSGAQGYISHELARCIEKADRYVLLVRWRRLEDHKEGFKIDPRYPEWKRLLHHYYDPIPTVQHFDPLEL